MTVTSTDYHNRWVSGEMVGPAAPITFVEIRKGRFFRGFHPWTYPEGKFTTPDYAIIPSSPNNQHGKPWQATWTPQTDWTTIPGLSQFTVQKDITANNGIGSATVVIENIRLLQETGPFDQLYHVYDRGYLAPWRGFKPPGRSPIVPNKNEWFERLARNSQIRIWQGYGEDTMVPIFNGLIDEAEFDSGQNSGSQGGDMVTLTARDFGRVLADETIFGWNKDPSLLDPVVFADRQEQKNNPHGAPYWVLVDDCADIVRLILRWAGFKHWEVYDTGVRITGTTTFNRSNFLIDPINAMCQATGFIFFIGDPDPNDPESLGVPVFRYPRALVDLPAPILLRDKQMLTDLTPTNKDDDRAYIIRVRGRINGPTAIINVPGVTNPIAPVIPGIKTSTLGGDLSQRPMFTYRPPWTQHNLEAGILKHVTHTDDTLITVEDCQIACYLIAAQEALDSATVQGDCVGNAAIGLDEHIAVMDHGTGMSTRIWTTSITHTWQWGADQESQEQLIFTTNFEGSLLDTPDLIQIKQELYGDKLSRNDRWVKVAQRT